MPDEKKTTIRVKRSTIEELKECGKMGDTLEDVIIKLIEFYKEKKLNFS